MSQPLAAPSFASSLMFHVDGEGWYYDWNGRLAGPYPTREKLILTLQRMRFQGPRVRRRPDYQWYVRTREGLMGGFDSQVAAESYLKGLKDRSTSRREEVWACARVWPFSG